MTRLAWNEAVVGEGGGVGHLKDAIGCGHKEVVHKNRAETFNITAAVRPPESRSEG